MSHKALTGIFVSSFAFEMEQYFLLCFRIHNQHPLFPAILFIEIFTTFSFFYYMNLLIHFFPFQTSQWTSEHLVLQLRSCLASSSLCMWSRRVKFLFCTIFWQSFQFCISHLGPKTVFIFVQLQSLETGNWSCVYCDYVHVQNERLEQHYYGVG